jgi:hypothetical protein
MQFRITGHIREKESGLSVPGLMIRAYDKDLLYDDLLGTAYTDEEGRFEMVYSEKDFRELFEGKPDVYLSVYAPPCRFLMDTKESVRVEASEQEHFELEIDRETLGDVAPTRPDDQVEGGISIPPDKVRLEKRDGFDIPNLAGFTLGGSPGAPALPEQTQYVALPLGGDVLSFEVIPGDPVQLSGEVNPLPVQMEMPGVEEIGAIQIAAVRVRPMQYDPASRVFVYYPNLRYVVSFDLEKAKSIADERRKKESMVGQYYSEQISTLLEQGLIVSAKFLYWPLIFLEEVPL